MANENHVSPGSVSSLPGAHHDVEDGACCDDHPDRPAVSKRQGETDSFGCEYYYLCADCVEEAKNAPPEDTSGTCDWCKSHADKLRPRRDYDEGLAGRVYYVCTACIKHDEARLAEEYADDDSDWEA